MPKCERFFTVSRRIPHLAILSGYDHLATHVGTRLKIPPLIDRVRGLGPLKRYLRKKSGMEWYDGMYAELFTALHMRRPGSRIYHFLFAERDFRYLPKLWPKYRHKVIGTFHATPREFEKVMKYTEHLKSIDAAIVVAKNQIPVLESIIGKEKVFSIPLGVETGYFLPPDQNYTPGKTCICVGHHHRDFQTLGEVAAIIKKHDPEVRIIVVDRVFSTYLSLEQQQTYKASFASAGNVELRADLTDEELLRLYQASDLMILPLFDSTANTAILEAMSCGLPLVVTDVGGVRDYVDPRGAAFVAPQDAETMADHVIRILQNREERERLSRSSRNQALSFDWRVIADKVKTLYHQVAGEITTTKLS
jgi:glycosyltransferase involved in cell wall biosynthesis